MSKFQVYAVGMILVLVIISTVVPYILGVLVLLVLATHLFAPRKTAYMTYSKYQEYLKSPKWKLIRIKVLRRDNYTCQHCGCSVTITTANVHHKTYIRLGDEDLDDLITLCIPCHQKEHE